MDDLMCFIGQKAFIEKNGKLLMMHDPQMGFDLPGGKIQEGEMDLAASLQREVKEETSLIIQVGAPFFTWFFTIPLNSGHRSAGKRIFNVGYKCKYISGDIVLSSEHDSYRWVDKDTYKECLQGASFSLALAEYFWV